MRPVRVGLLGLGTVGCGTVDVLRRNREEIIRRAGRAIEPVAAAVRDPARPRSCPVDGLRLTTRPEEVVADPAVDIVVELIGGLEPARSLVLAAIERGRHVVTANKALIAHHGNEIFAAAHERGVMVAFEAAVAGGIPVIKAVREGLAGNCLRQVAGIINGTCNYILTAMREEGAEFEAVLAEAQRLGYAEADPSFDIDGIDAAHKLTILGSLAFGIPLQYERVHVEGIRGVSRADVAFAAELGYRIKHLGIARRTGRGVELRVHPTLVPARELIASVDGVMNAVLVEGDAVGTTLFYGAGAGADPTASAVVADLVDVTRALTADPGNRVPHLAFQPDALADLAVVPMAEVESRYYLRMQVEDRPGVLAEIARILGEEGISIEAVLQKEPAAGAADVPLIMLTHRVREGQVERALTRMRGLACMRAGICRIRLESFE
ncbi:homoserine dehydrogenase [Inmirania thermothiophila]|uniref:Homoserine dehydrogenase n=1 Tax=Inmirania thermothiophila TaxID=1750597 RepID=A0A3N1Y0S1_9GAMM|nr:homoserine dehydrogenase [Inmirania thermothiophila]ROR32108.1 homoserine dehydrogenase [Inmirania thermothiophila]